MPNDKDLKLTSICNNNLSVIILQWLSRRNKKALYDALEKLKAGMLGVMGYVDIEISLLDAIFSVA